MKLGLIVEYSGRQLTIPMDLVKDEAAASIPDQLVDDVALCGPPERIQHRMQAWNAAGRDKQVGTMILGSLQPDALRVIAEAMR